MYLKIIILGTLKSMQQKIFNFLNRKFKMLGNCTINKFSMTFYFLLLLITNLILLAENHAENGNEPQQKLADDVWLDQVYDYLNENSDKIYEHGGILHGELVSKLLNQQQGAIAIEGNGRPIGGRMGGKIENLLENCKLTLGNLLEDLQQRANKILDFCWQTEQWCKIWWLSYRQTVNSFVNPAAKEIRMTHVQWFQTWLNKALYFEGLLRGDQWALKSPHFEANLLWIQQIYDGQSGNGGKNNETTTSFGGMQQFPVYLKYYAFFEHKNVPLYHAEIGVHGIDFSFGDQNGIYIYAENMRALEHEAWKLVECRNDEIVVKQLGLTTFAPAQLQLLLDQFHLGYYAPPKYDLIVHNCQHFVRHMAEMLLSSVGGGGAVALDEKWPRELSSGGGPLCEGRELAERVIEFVERSPGLGCWQQCRGQTFFDVILGAE